VFGKPCLYTALSITFVTWKKVLGVSYSVCVCVCIYIYIYIWTVAYKILAETHTVIRVRIPHFNFIGRRIY